MKELKRLAEFRVTDIGVEQFPEMQFQEWVAFGHRLGRVHRALQWTAADWINAGEVQYAGKYSQAVSVLGRKYGTLGNWCGIAKAFPFSRRRENLTFSHHATLYNEFPELSEKQQDRYLDLAEREDWSVADMREAIRLDLAKAGRTSRVEDDTAPNPFKFLSEFRLAYRKLGEPASWPQPQREAWKRELQPIVDLYNRL